MSSGQVDALNEEFVRGSEDAMEQTNEGATTADDDTVSSSSATGTKRKRGASRAVAAASSESSAADASALVPYVICLKQKWRTESNVSAGTASS